MRPIRDLSGQRFGFLVVTYKCGTHKKGHAIWRCVCDCGVTKDIISPSLVTGRVRSCGCSSGILSSMTQTVDLCGKKFGKLTVISLAERKKNCIHWLCQCDCGKECIRNGKNMVSGQTMSCGCILKKHGGVSEGHLAYSSWASMIQRCTNPNAEGYETYGGRGISVCNRWLESYSDFLADMGHRPSLKHTIDRINNDGNYEPGNCRWATPSVQQRNRRGVRKITIDGVTKCLTEWAESVGMLPVTLAGRLRRGMSPAEAISKPVRSTKGGV